MFHHPTWAVGSYGISQSAGGTSQNIIFKTLRQIGRPALYNACVCHPGSSKQASECAGQHFLPPPSAPCLTFKNNLSPLFTPSLPLPLIFQIKAGLAAHPSRAGSACHAKYRTCLNIGRARMDVMGGVGPCAAPEV